MNLTDCKSRLWISALVAWLCCGWVQGEPPRIDRIVDPSGGFDGLRDVLQYAVVREALELRSDQYVALQRLDSNQQAASRVAMGNWRDLPAEQRTSARLQDELRAVRGMILPVIEQTLDDSQVTRLKQLQLQLRIQREVFAPLSSKEVMSELLLTPDQVRDWRATIAEQQTRYRGKIAALHAEIPEALMRTLSPEQRRKYQDVFGDAYANPSTLPKFENRRVPGRGFPPMLDLVRYPGIRPDLEILDEQQEKVAGLLSEYRRQERALTLQWRSRDARSNRPPARDEKGKQDELRRNEQEAALQQKEIQNLHEKSRMLLEEILLPHQIKRLQQLVLQAHAQSQSNLWLMTEVAAEAIELTPEQRKQLRESCDIESTKVQEESSRLYEASLAQIFGSLSEQQQVRYKLLVGTPFTLSGKDD